MGCFDVFCMLCGGPLGCNFDDPDEDQYAFYKVQHHADAMQSYTAWLGEVCVLTRTGLVRDCVYEDYGRCVVYLKRDAKSQKVVDLRKYFVVTRQNWCAEKGESEPGIPIHAACYALLVAHLPGAKALAEQDDSEEGESVDSRAVAAYLFEFAEKHLAQSCCYTLDCLCVEPLEKAHDQFFTFHHPMLWALCHPVRPSLPSPTKLIEASNSTNSSKRTAKTRGKKKKQAGTLGSPLIEVLPPLFEHVPEQSIDLACFSGMADIFNALVLDHWSSFDALALLGQLSKSFYFHMAKQWKKVVRCRHPVLFAEIMRLQDARGVPRFTATDKEDSDALDWHRLMITLVSRYELFAIMRTCGNAVEQPVSKDAGKPWTIATLVKKVDDAELAVEANEKKENEESASGVEEMDVVQPKRSVKVRQLDILKKYQKSQRRLLGPESGEEETEYKVEENDDEENDDESSEELSEDAVVKKIGPFASDEKKLVSLAFDEYGVRSWLRMCVLVGVVVREVQIYESTEQLGLTLPPLAPPKFRSLDYIMNPPNTPPQPRTRLEFRKLQQQIAELHRKQGGECANLIDSDLATNNAERGFRRKMIRFDAGADLKRSCALCSYNLCWHMMCKCGFGLCTECYFLYDIFFAPEAKENAAQSALPEKKRKVNTNEKKRKVDKL